MHVSWLHDAIALEPRRGPASYTRLEVRLFCLSACKLLEVLIIHCHHSLMRVGGAGSVVGGAGSLVGGMGIQMNNVMSQCVGGVTEETRIQYIHHCKTLVEKST